MGKQYMKIADDCKLSIGDKLRVTRDDAPRLVGKTRDGMVLEIQEIKESPSGPEANVRKLDNGAERCLSPTTIAEGLGLVSYKENPDTYLELVDK